MANEIKEWEHYKLTNPREQVGLPNNLKWAVAKNGNFQDAYSTEREAKDVCRKENESPVLAYSFIFSVGANTHRAQLFESYSKENGLEGEHFLSSEHTRYRDVLKDVREYLTKEQIKVFTNVAKARELFIIVMPDGKVHSY